MSGLVGSGLISGVLMPCLNGMRQQKGRTSYEELINCIVYV